MSATRRFEQRECGLDRGQAADRPGAGREISPPGESDRNCRRSAPFSSQWSGILSRKAENSKLRRGWPAAIRS